MLAHRRAFAQRDVLEAIHVVPDLVPAKDLFADFPALKAALPNLQLIARESV